MGINNSPDIPQYNDYYISVDRVCGRAQNIRNGRNRKCFAAAKSVG